MKRFAYLFIFAAGCTENKPVPSVGTVPTTKPAVTATKPIAAKVQETKPVPPPVVEKSLPTREEFTQSVYNKTQDEVVKAVGKADQVTDENWGNERVIVWKYFKATQDKNAKNPDRIAELWFIYNSKVSEVKFR